MAKWKNKHQLFIVIVFFNKQKWNLYINKEGGHPSTRSAKELPNNYKRIISIKER